MSIPTFYAKQTQWTTPCCTILLLTEDSSKNGLRTVEALVKGILSHILPGKELPAIDFQPVQNEEAAAAIRGNLWKSRLAEDHRKRLALCREIAGVLSQEKGFVFFHVDGDCTWKESRNGTKSENVEKFRKVMRNQIALVLGEALTRSLPAPRSSTTPVGRRRPSRGDLSPHADPTGQLPREVELEVARRLERLFLLVPFWCIESWLYQNVDVADAICRENDGGRHRARFDMWRKDRGSLDEIRSPKSKSETCLKDKYNLRLAREKYPVEDVYAVGKSLARAVDMLKESEPLMHLLNQTDA